MAMIEMNANGRSWGDMRCNPDRAGGDQERGHMAEDRDDRSEKSTTASNARL